jgi:hypothetical protein
MRRPLLMRPRLIRSPCACLLLYSCLATATWAEPGRFLYVLGCDARLTKIDTVLERKVGRTDLAGRTAGHRIIPKVRGALDGCLSNQAVYDPRASRFYHLLGFSIPQMRLVQDTAAGDSLPDLPHLEMDQAMHVSVINASDWSPQTDLDLRGFGAEGAPIRNQLLESAGREVLLRIFTAHEGKLVIGVADRESKALAYLRELPDTTARNVHLAPGGGFVLVEEVASASPHPEKTGRVILIRRHDGTVDLQRHGACDQDRGVSRHISGRHGHLPRQRPISIRESCTTVCE